VEKGAKSVEKQGIFREKAPSAALTGPWRELSRD